MGSAADLDYGNEVSMLAERVGELLAEHGATVVYGAEKDYDSLSTAAARGAKRKGGLTIGVTYGKGMDIWDKEGNTDVIIVTGLERGGGREFVLVNSCDAIIAISGGASVGGVHSPMVFRKPEEVCFRIDSTSFLISASAMSAER